MHIIVKWICDTEYGDLAEHLRQLSQGTVLLHGDARLSTDAHIFTALQRLFCSTLEQDCVLFEVVSHQPVTMEAGF